MRDLRYIHLGVSIEINLKFSSVNSLFLSCARFKAGEDAACGEVLLIRAGDVQVMFAEPSIGPNSISIGVSAVFVVLEIQVNRALAKVDILATECPFVSFRAEPLQHLYGLREMVFVGGSCSKHGDKLSFCFTAFSLCELVEEGED
ncbi:hypothetical protein V6N13_110586 [Hibiscus sabdariffa]